MANVFVHFEPIGPIEGSLDVDGDLPPYVIKGSPEEKVWRANNPNGHTVIGLEPSFTTGTTSAHKFAANEDYDMLVKYLDANMDVVIHRDANGWTPLAEAVKKGNEKIVRLLLDRGSEPNARLGKDATGGSILHMAKQELGEDHSVFQLLKSRGARIIPPDGSKEEL